MSQRARRLAAQLPELEVDFLLISAAVNVSYLTGYTGSNGIALIAAGDPDCGWFYTDFRYATQSAEQVDGYFQREIIASGGLLVPLAETLAAAQGASSRRLGFDEEHLSVKQYRHLAELLGEEWELVQCAGAVERLRAVKEPVEIARIRAAADLIDELLRWISERGLIGRTERELAVALEHQMRLLGAQGPSFPSIVASGAHGALPHATPRDVQIQPRQLVTIDLGALLDGYCSDCTRTFATGELPAEEREIYALVLRAQLTGLQAVKPGVSGQDVDSAARDVISQAGHAEHFGHSLGHGVGMEVHEGPRLAQTAAEQFLSPGNIVTVEPGVYIPNHFGLRIEDLVLVTEDGHEILSRFSKELQILS